MPGVHDLRTGGRRGDLQRDRRPLPRGRRQLRGGERLSFLRRVPGATSDRLEMENVVKPGAGPIMHVHNHQEEALTVVEGRIGYQRLGEPAHFAVPGQMVTFRAGRSTGSGTPARRTSRAGATSSRPTTIEYFLGAIFESQKRSGGSRPDPFDAAFLARRYRSEFGIAQMSSPPHRCDGWCCPWWWRSAGYSGVRKVRRRARARSPLSGLERAFSEPPDGSSRRENRYCTAVLGRLNRGSTELPLYGQRVEKVDVERRTTRNRAQKVPKSACLVPDLG